MIRGTFYAQVPGFINEMYKDHAGKVLKAYQRGDRGKGSEIPLETMRIIARVAHAGLLSGKQVWIDKASKKSSEMSESRAQPGLPFCISVIPSKALARRMFKNNDEVVNPAELLDADAENFYVNYFLSRTQYTESVMSI